MDPKTRNLVVGFVIFLFVIVIVITIILITASTGGTSPSDPVRGANTTERPVPPCKIFFGAEGGYVEVYSEATNAVSRVAYVRVDHIPAVAYSSANNQLYFSTKTHIYNTDLEGPSTKLVFAASHYESIWGLAVDLITGNLYGVTTGGYIFACTATTFSGSLTCTTLSQGQGHLCGIALSPSDGKMFLTAKNPGRIIRANMDGSNPVVITGGLAYPGGILVDHASALLFWADHDTNRIQSSGLDGRNVQTLVQMANKTGPWGIGLHNGRLFWGNWQAKSLQSSDKSGQDVHTLYTGQHGIWKLALQC